MNKYLVRNFKWRENLGKVPAKVYRLANFKIRGRIYATRGASMENLSCDQRDTVFKACILGPYI